ncbi:MAG: serine--tRNA ligase [Candidatus Jorgensenbacteria bacterium]|nr:serine--tRNA ligase [Candidatus Jorgensenbacteria bacterium]
MIDITFIRENSEKVKKGMESKRQDPKIIDKFLRLDEEWRAKTSAYDQMKAEQNTLSKEMSAGQSENLLSKAQFLKKRLSEVESEQDDLKKIREDLLSRIPNIPFDDVPAGRNEEENKVLREVGEKPEFDFTPKDYLTIGEKLGLIDVKRASEVSGSRFGYILRDAALLEFALIQLAFDTLTKKGFIPAVPPVMIKPKVYEGMGRLAADQKEERYYFEKDDVYLVGSSEHTMGPIHMNDVFEEENLPRRYVAFSTCFRREAGSYGKDTKGILRVHQFDKVEMFSFAHPDKSEEEHKFLLSCQEELMQKLEIPYRVVEICTGDMGWTDARQFDVETWFPGQGSYRETNSCSNTTDFQSRGMNIKYKTKDGKKALVHMLNATGFAIGRVLIGIIENNQTKEGNIRVPKILQAYVGKEEITG